MSKLVSILNIKNLFILACRRDGVANYGEWAKGTHGVVVAKHEPKLYKQPERCEWHITVPKGDKVKLTFTAFYQLNLYSQALKWCRSKRAYCEHLATLLSKKKRKPCFDGSIQIIEETPCEKLYCPYKPYRKRQFCGQRMKFSVFSSGRHVRVVYKSAAWRQRQGFYAKWKAVSADGKAIQSYFKGHGSLSKTIRK